MYVNLRISDFRDLQPNNKIFIKSDDSYKEVVVKGYAFYNDEVKKPRWEIRTDAGWVKLDDAYKNVVVKITDNMVTMPLEEFKMLRAGDVIAVHLNGEYKETLVTCGAFRSVSTKTFCDEEDWEVSTNIGFVHNDCVYVSVD